MSDAAFAISEIRLPARTAVESLAFQWRALLRLCARVGVISMLYIIMNIRPWAPGPYATCYSGPCSCPTLSPSLGLEEEAAHPGGTCAHRDSD